MRDVTMNAGRDKSGRIQPTMKSEKFQPKTFVFQHEPEPEMLRGQISLRHDQEQHAKIAGTGREIVVAPEREDEAE